MNSQDYTAEQREDIERRVAKAKDALQELHLQLGCMPMMNNMGDDVFGIKLIPYLHDTLFTPQKSPLSQ